MISRNLYEEKAAEFLKLIGYKIIERNFFTRWGEIDIIAKDKKILSFLEVKARDKNSLVKGREAVDKYKIKKIRKTAMCYLSKMKDRDRFFRFDVLEIIQGKNWRQYNLIKEAFDY
jgi:putative endonuclease